MLLGCGGFISLGSDRFGCKVIFVSSLCIECHPCCDGSLFARVSVQEGERARLPETAGIVQREGAFRMPLPCACLGSDGRCEVYAHRPEACRAYRCRLVKAMEAGEIEDAAARSILSQLRRLQNEAVDLACRAMDMAAAPGMTWAEAIAALEAADREGRPVNGFAAARARLRRREFAALVSKHVQPGYTSRSGSAV